VGVCETQGSCEDFQKCVVSNALDSADDDVLTEASKSSNTDKCNDECGSNVGFR
jgi:hypothetical protein